MADHKNSRTAEEITRDLERLRAKLQADVHALEQRLDWRDRIRRRPGASLGMFFAVGVVIGLI
jgi:hypothetical protein